MCISNITEENTGEKLRANVWSKANNAGRNENLFGIMFFSMLDEILIDIPQ